MNIQKHINRLQGDLRDADLHMRQNPGKVDGGVVSVLQSCLHQAIMEQIRQEQEDEQGSPTATPPRPKRVMLRPNFSQFLRDIGYAFADTFAHGHEIVVGSVLMALISALKTPEEASLLSDLISRAYKKLPKPIREAEGVTNETDA